MTWEVERFEWKDLRAMGPAPGLPAAIVALGTAMTKEDADRAYWQIDNVAVVQGALFEASVAVTTCVVSSLPHCSSVSRERLLELLAQLGGGESHPDEVDRGHGDLRQRCIGEIAKGFACYVSILEHGTTAERTWCVDLLGLCAMGDHALVERVIWYLKRLQREVQGTDLSELINNWLHEHLEG